jgi:hypothetical protein
MLTTQLFSRRRQAAGTQTSILSARRLQGTNSSTEILKRTADGLCYRSSLHLNLDINLDLARAFSVTSVPFVLLL